MKKAWKLWFPLLGALLITIVIGVGVLQRIDKWVQDLFFQQPHVTSGDIVIIGIDEEAFDLLGPYHTWDRNIMAAALEALSQDPENKPAVTAIDVLYAGNTVEATDDRLARAADELGNVVTAAMAEFGESITWEDGRAVAGSASAIVDYEQPYEQLRACTTQGHINAMTDLDGVLRHALLYVEPDGERVYSMACETARKYLEQHGEDLVLPPVNRGGHFYVPFTSGPGGYYDGVSIAWLLEGKVPAQYWAGKIVLIGPYAPALQDAYFTSVDKGQPMYGVEFQANVIQSLLNREFKKEVTDLPQLLLLFVLCVILMVLYLRLKVLPGGALCAGTVLVGLGGAVLLYRIGFVLHTLWLPVGSLVLYVASLAVHYAMAAKERQALALEKERIGAELALASRIQTSFVPKEFPPFPDRKEFDIFASMTPAKEVGGDLYDFFMIDSDHLGLVIADVSGKGVPAALFMMVSSALLRHAAMHEESPAKALQIVNNQICARNPEEMFVTVWLATLEISTGRLRAVNAGHEYPAIKAAEGSFELVKDVHGFVVGGMEGTRYREYELQLSPGSKLFLYTDGVAEATNADEQLFGTERMLETLRSVEDGSPEEILATVKNAVLTFTGDAPQFDDLTMMCLQYNG